jgi:dextranase
VKILKIIPICFCIAIGLTACVGKDNDDKEIEKVVLAIEITTDKARYAPGEDVIFTLAKSAYAGSRVRYSFSGNTVAEESINDKSWRWTPPATDFRGYLVEVFIKDNDSEKIIATTAVDVSSDWTHFPRYGFLSSYNKTKTFGEINTVIDNLNRHHINGIQYYDWLYDHHKPLAGSPANPADSWLDLIGRLNTRQTAEAYLAAAKSHNMASMWYDLCYGALNNAGADGVMEDWYLFKNSNRTNKDLHQLGAPFRSSIYVVNPGNPEWLDYFSRQVKDVYEVYDFDGYHIDQLGDRGRLYDYSGTQVNLPDEFGKFIRRMASDFPNRRHVFNAVSGYGQQQIATAGVDFLYNEIWGEAANYADLKTVIDNNRSCNSALNSVFAAYMNYDLAKQKGIFNTPGVLMTDAVIFALGAAHLELGEHILDSEYFPNDNLQPDNTLKAALIRYYDFLVAYQNLLRDGGEFNEITISFADVAIPVAAWPPQSGKIICLSKKTDAKQVVHLLNFANAVHLQWRDLNGTQAEPRLYQNMNLQINISQPVKKVWVATPDKEGKMYEELNFTQSDNLIKTSIPALKYWTMLVLEQ